MKPTALLSLRVIPALGVVAFLTASTLAAAEQLERRPVAYSVATGVALSRTNDNVHFASDVVAGAIVGTAIGKSITSRHRRSTQDVWAVSPLVTDDGFGITVAVPFETIASRIRWYRPRYRHASFVQAE